MKTLWFVLIIILLAISGTALAVKPGTAQGTFSIDGKSILLSQIKAVQYTALPEVGIKAELRLMLTDKLIADNPAWPVQYFFGPLGPFHEKVKAGEFSGVMLKIDPKIPRGEMNGLLLYPPKDKTASLVSFYGIPTIKDLKISADRIAGELSYSYQSVGEDLPGFSFTCSFDAPIVPDQKVTAKLFGPKALASPQVKAFLTYAQACRDADLSKIKGAVTARSYGEFAAMKDQSSAEEIKEMLSGLWPPPNELKKQIRQVIVRGKQSWIILGSAEEKLTKTVIQEDGVWKVD